MFLEDRYLAVKSLLFNVVFYQKQNSGGTEVWIVDRNYTPFWSNVQRQRGMYLAMIERRLQ